MRTVTCLRHSKTNPLVPGADDKTTRHLTEQGIEIARKSRERLGKPRFDLIIGSTADRTVETATVIAGDATVDTIMLDELYPTGKDLDRAFKKLAYAPYGTYIDDSEGSCIMSHGKKMARAVERALAQHPNKHDVLLVGHAVVLTSMVCEMKRGMCTQVCDHIFDEIVDYALGECEGYILTVDDENRITSVELVCK